MKGNHPITIDDLKSELFQSMFADWVRGTIRKCFLTFLPVIVTIGGAFISFTVWYLQDIRSMVKDTSASVNYMNIRMSTSEERIKTLEEQNLQMIRKIYK